MQRAHIGIDPGQRGAVVRIDPDGTVTTARGEDYYRSAVLDITAAVEALASVGAQRGDWCVVEMLQVRPGQDVRATRTTAVSWAQWQPAAQMRSLLYSTRSTRWADRLCGIRHPPGRRARKVAVCSWAMARYPGVPGLLGPRGGVHDGIADALAFAHAMRVQQGLT